MYCDGGLSSCTVCNGGEASLMDECPGVSMSFDEQELVMRGVIRTPEELFAHRASG